MSSGNSLQGHHLVMSIHLRRQELETIHVNDFRAHLLEHDALPSFQGLVVSNHQADEAVVDVSIFRMKMPGPVLFVATDAAVTHGHQVRAVEVWSDFCHFSTATTRITMYNAPANSIAPAMNPVNFIAKSPQSLDRPSDCG